MCEIQGCDEVAIYLDEDDNKMCQSCVNQEQMETMRNDDDYELIENMRTHVEHGKILHLLKGIVDAQYCKGGTLSALNGQCANARKFLLENKHLTN